MGTTSTSASTSASANAASIAAPLVFTGLSTFSSDFQSIIARSAQIADIPVSNLQNQVTTITAEQSALTAIEPGVTAVGADVTALGALATSQALAATSSDSSTVSVQNTGAANPASYTVSDITSLASAASETSLAGYSATQAVSSTGLVNLVVGSNTYQLNLTGSGQNNVAGLAAAINNSGAGVTATVLTSGSTQYVTISAAATGATTLQLNNVTPADLVSGTGTGTETSLQAYADATSTPVSASGQVELAVGSNTFSLNVSGNNNLNGLAQAINSVNAGVTASVTGSAGAYSLSITSASGPTTIQLNDLQNPTDLITDTNQGSNASFSLNGVPITQSSNNVTSVIPGLSFTLLNTNPTGSVTLSLATDPTQLSSALETFVTDYNTLVSQVEAQQGQNAGPLQGDLIINQISGDMQQLATYYNPNSSSTIRSLSDLGVTFNNTGQMSFDANTFNSLSDTQISDAFKFIGSANSGFAALANNFTEMTDPISGLIATQINGYTTENTDLGNQITAAQARATLQDAAATSQAEAADATVAELQSEASSLDASIQSVNYSLYGKQVGSNGI